MAELLASTASITSEIEKLIDESGGGRLILVTPYLRIAPQFKVRIRDQVKFNTKITIVIREGESHDPADIRFLQEVRAGLHTRHGLHATCYLNQKTAIITSLNLYEYSRADNPGMGVKVTSEDDPGLYNDISDAIKKIVRDSPLFRSETKTAEIPAPVSRPRAPKKLLSFQQKKTRGYCIRCGAEIPLNPEKPLCFKCFPGWAKFSDPTYPEKYCHVCGKESKQSLGRPVCNTCEKKMYR